MSTRCPQFSAEEIARAFSPRIPDTGAIPEMIPLLERGDGFRYEGDPRKSPASLFEVEFAQRVGMRFAVAVNSCTSAMELALRMLRLRGFDTRLVLTPAFTFTAVPGAIINANCTPVLVNVGQDLKIDIADLEHKMRTTGAKVLLLSHMRGHVSDMAKVVLLCRAYGVTLLEDAAHALGATWNGKPVGSFGLMAFFSLQGYKMIRVGEGGVLVTNDETLAAMAAIIQGAYEERWKYHLAISEEIFRSLEGTLSPSNFRIDEMAAVRALGQLRQLDARIKTYRSLYERFVASLQRASGLIVFPEGDLREQRAPDSVQFFLPSLDDEAVRSVVAHMKQAGFPFSCIGTDKGNARHPKNWKYLDEQSLVGLEPTFAVLRTLCDMRLPLTLEDGVMDYTVRTLVDAMPKQAAA